MKLLITGATGKVGTNLIAGLRTHPRFCNTAIRALCHNRTPDPALGVECIHGNISDRADVSAALEGVTHVIHLATCKEVPETVMDVTVKGLFWLLEAFRSSPEAQQFILLGGDASVGHFFYDHGGPVTESTPHRAYPGCYALSKVLEEVMLAQYVIQYGVNACCLRAPWIMEKDDFRFSLSFGDDVFGGPDWKTLVPAEVADRCRRDESVPRLCDAAGRPIKRNFIHVSDLVSAIVAALDNPITRGKTYNIAMTDPVDYAVVANHLAETRGLGAIDIQGPYHSTHLDNARARSDLGWSPLVDTKRLIDLSWAYQRAADDPRKVWYPG